MFGDLRSDITVNSQYLKVVVVGGDFVDVLICYLAVWIPLCREVDYHEGEPVACQVVVHQVQLDEAFEGCKPHAEGYFSHHCLR